MIRVRKYSIKDQVRLNELAVNQNLYTDQHEIFKKLFEETKKGEVIRIEEMLPGNSNFRYTVQFGKTILTLNETQLEKY
ncbi:MAG: hypothetical protein NVS9B7_17160 [Flavisolibacter sp.]